MHAYVLDKHGYYKLLGVSASPDTPVEVIQVLSLAMPHVNFLGWAFSKSCLRD
jgi:hypothetical protein